MVLNDKALKVKNMNVVHKHGYKYPVEKWIEVITAVMVLGNQRLAAAQCNIDYALLRQWKTTQKWKDLEAEIRAQRSAGVNSKLNKIVDKSLELIQDRLDNGDIIYNQKTGKIERKEVSLRDVTKVATDLMTKQIELQKFDKEEIVVKEQVSMADQLANLAQEFARFNGRNTGPVQDAVILKENDLAVYDPREEGLQEGEREVQFSSREYQEESGEEQSSFSDGEGRAGTEG